MKLRFFYLALLLLLGIGHWGCLGSGESDGDQNDIADLIIFMFNDSDAPIHLLTPGESMGPSNEVIPGASRQGFVGQAQKGEVLKFSAGRNGIICQEIYCEVTDVNREDQEVIWENNPGSGPNVETLSCDNGLKINNRTILDAFCAVPLP